MYPIIAGVRAVLLADTEVGALIAGPEDVSALERPRTAAGDNQTCIVMSVVSAPDVRTLDGAASGQITRLAVVCRGETYAATFALQSAASAALDDYQGMPLPGYGRIRCWLGSHTDGLEDTGDPADPDGSQIVRIVLDLMVKVL